MQPTAAQLTMPDGSLLRERGFRSEGDPGAHGPRRHHDHHVTLEQRIASCKRLGRMLFRKLMDAFRISFTDLREGGGPMRNELTVTCIYPEGGRNAREILLESFQLFLRRELGSAAKG